MFTTLTDAIVETVTLGAPSTYVPSSGVFAVRRFFHPSLSFSWKERSVPNKYTTILRFQNLLIVKLFNNLIFLN